MAERRTPNSARRFSTDVFTTAFSATEAVGLRQMVHRQPRQPGGNFHQRQKLLGHSFGKKIHYRTGPRGPSPFALLVTQAAKRVFEPLPSCFEFDGQI